MIRICQVIRKIQNPETKKSGKEIIRKRSKNTSIHFFSFCVFWQRSKAQPSMCSLQSLKLKAGAQKKMALKTLAMQKQIDNLGTRFYSDDNDHAELLERLSLLIAAKKRPSYQIVSFISFFLLVVSNKMNKVFPDFIFPDYLTIPHDPIQHICHQN
jgi:hypothetical protein